MYLYEGERRISQTSFLLYIYTYCTFLFVVFDSGYKTFGTQTMAVERANSDKIMEGETVSYSIENLTHMEEISILGIFYPTELFKEMFRLKSVNMLSCINNLSE